MLTAMEVYILNVSRYNVIRCGLVMNILCFIQISLTTRHLANDNELPFHSSQQRIVMSNKLWLGTQKMKIY